MTNKIYHVDFKQSKKKMSFHCGGGHFKLEPDGVFYIKRDKDGNELPPLWISSPLYVEAKTRDTNNGEWGRLLYWLDDDGEKHQWAMPIAMLQGDTSDLRRELASWGLDISPHKIARELLSSYIQTYPVKERAICVDKLGWHEKTYVTEEEVITQAGSNEKIVFQNVSNLHSGLSINGSVDEWQNEVSTLAKGNSRLVFSISLAFASNLLKFIEEDSGGFHLRGASSTGKSTALSVASSVWGNPKEYIRLWRSTSNALEGLASLHNDGLLILDEINQMDPKEAGESAYLLANGQGKNRANKHGQVKRSATWSLLFLSAGEESLSSLMARGGQKPTAGQEIRLADIEADASRELGIFEDIHQYKEPAKFALALKNAANQYHGAVGLAWLKKIVATQEEIKPFLEEHISLFIEKMTGSYHSGQIKRVARRFALVSAAGELATELGFTGWERDESFIAAAICFKAWLDDFGSNGKREDRAILAQVRDFFESHGSSRFENVEELHNPRISNRAGFYKLDENGAKVYFVLAGVYRNEICKGFNIKMVNKLLKSLDWIVPGQDGKSSQMKRVKGVGLIRGYEFTSKLWSDEI